MSETGWPGWTSTIHEALLVNQAWASHVGEAPRGLRSMNASESRQKQKHLLVISGAAFVVALLAAGAAWMLLVRPTPVADPDPSSASPELARVCSSFLRLVNTAKEKWAEKNPKSAQASPPTWDDLGPYLGRDVAGELPECPCGGICTIGRVGEPPTCSLRPEEHTRKLADAHLAAKRLLGAKPDSR